MATSNCAAKALSGLARDCSTSQGGIKAVWIAPYEDVTKIELNEGGDKIATISMNLEAKFKKYNFRKNTGSMSSTLTVDQANGVNYVTTNLVLSFLRQDTQKRIEMSALAVNELAVIVEDSNSTLWYLGYNEAVSATAGEGTTGQNKTDGNKYSITLTDDSETFPFEVERTALSTIVDAE